MRGRAFLIKAVVVLVLLWILVRVFGPLDPFGLSEPQTGSIPIAEGTLQGQDVRFIIDTGAVVSYLDETYAGESESVYVVPDPKSEEFSWANPQETQRIQMSLGCGEFSMSRIQIIDLAWYLRGGSPPVVGLLGWEQLSRMTIRIDMETRIAHCSDVQDMASVGPKMKFIEFSEERGPHFDVLVTNRETGESREIRALFDTGLGVGALLSLRVARDLELDLTDSKTRLESGARRRRPKLWETSVSVAMGGDVNRHRVHVPDEEPIFEQRRVEMLIGTGFFDGAGEIWIDRKGVRVVSKD